MKIKALTTTMLCFPCKISKQVNMKAGRKYVDDDITVIGFYQTHLYHHTLSFMLSSM